MKLKAQVMDAVAVSKAMTRISYEIIERADDLSNIVLVGVKTRGVPLAAIISDNVLRLANVKLPVYDLDVTLYRDDIKEKAENKRKIDFPVEGKDVIIVDDVLFTGRTTRACMDAILDSGRANSIRLAVLMDRGHRELPIRADFVGKNVPTSAKEKVVVKIFSVDGETGVAIYEH